jgi:hypothetical protein
MGWSVVGAVALNVSMYVVIAAVVLCFLARRRGLLPPWAESSMRLWPFVPLPLILLDRWVPHLVGTVVVSVGGALFLVPAFYGTFLWLRDRRMRGADGPTTPAGM